jgi:ABC-type nitrate/sulfonate/bicarbonate transport system permease component
VLPPKHAAPILPSVFQILTNTIFLSGWGVVLLSALTTTILAGGPGVALGYVIHKKEFLSHYTLRFLRLGLWLPVYLFWGLPIWRIPIHDDGFMLALDKIGTGVMATGPSVFLAASYNYLHARVRTHGDETKISLALFREVLLFALLLTLLWQLFFPRVWPWGWLVHSLAANYAAVSAIAATVFFVNLLCRWTLRDRTESNDAKRIDQSQGQNSHSLMAVLLLILIILSFWQVLGSTVRNRFGIAAPIEVGQAIVQLLVTSSNAFMDKSTTTIWFDIGVSLVNIFAGVGLATLLAMAFVKAGSKYLSLKLSSFIMTLTCIAPIALGNLIMLWFGIGILQKIITLVCFSFFPLAQAFWNCRSSQLMPTILLSIDAGLPYAFIGMLFSEAMAATSGIGFFMIVFPANGHLAEATATGLIAFTLLTAISLALRFTARQILRSA